MRQVGFTCRFAHCTGHRKATCLDTMQDFTCREWAMNLSFAANLRAASATAWTYTRCVEWPLLPRRKQTSRAKCQICKPYLTATLLPDGACNLDQILYRTCTLL